MKNTMNTNEVKIPRVLKATQVAEVLGCSVRTVARYVEQGMLTPIRLNKRVIRYKAEEVENLFAS